MVTQDRDDPRATVEWFMARVVMSRKEGHSDRQFGASADESMALDGALKLIVSTGIPMRPSAEVWDAYVAGIELDEGQRLADDSIAGIPDPGQRLATPHTFYGVTVNLGPLAATLIDLSCYDALPRDQDDPDTPGSLRIAVVVDGTFVGVFGE